MGPNTAARKKSNGRNRMKYSQEQLDLLDRTFMTSQYPDTATLEDLADQLDVTVEKVSVWFQNRRSKFKRQSKDTHVAWMRKQFYGTDQGSLLASTSNINSTQRHVLSPPELKIEQKDFTCNRPSSNLHYKPQLSPFMESLLDHSSSSSCSNSPPSSNLMSTNVNVSESTPIYHRAFYRNTYHGNQQFVTPPSSSGLPSCQFYNNSYSTLQYPSQSQFPTPYPMVLHQEAQ